MEEYERALFSKEIIYKRTNNIQSQKQQIFTNEINKIALSYDDDKRNILNDDIHTLALGHYKII